MSHSFFCVQAPSMTHDLACAACCAVQIRFGVLTQNGLHCFEPHSFFEFVNFMLLGPSSPIHFLGMSEQGLFDIHGAGFCIFVIQNLPAWTRYPQVFQSTQNAPAGPLPFFHEVASQSCLLSKLLISKKSESETQSLFPAPLASHLLNASRGVGTIHRAVALLTFSGTTPIRKTLLVPFLVCTFLNSLVFLTKRILCSHLFLLPAFSPNSWFCLSQTSPSVQRCL